MRHPLHPAIVHFPVACWSLATAADFASLWLGEIAWQWSAGLLAIGCAIAVVAMLAGMIEIPRVAEGAAMNTLWAHMSAMLVAFSCFLISLLIRLDAMQASAPATAEFVLDAAGFIALAIGGWLGGRLVYGYGVGS